MTVHAVRDVTDVTRITKHSDARDVALAVYDLALAELEELADDDWGAITPDCPDWTVADMVGHLIGNARMGGSAFEMIRQQVKARPRASRFDGNITDAVNDLHVREHEHLTTEQKLQRLRACAPASVRGRLRTPGLVRRQAVKVPTNGSWAPGFPGRLRLGHLMDAVLTRDVWMHRLDIARAIGRTLPLDTDVDARIVEDVVAEWAGLHGQPFVLHLQGPAGGTFRSGDGGQELRTDVATFCRTLSGREPGDGLLRTLVFF
jgi:uncharacterized protein (TIGR03083 family)